MGKGSGKGGGGGAGGGGRPVAGAGGASQEHIPVPSDEKPEQHFHQDPVAMPGGVLAGKGVKVEDLSAKDKESILAYTGGWVDNGARFKELNSEKLNMYFYDRQRFMERYGDVTGIAKRAEAYAKELNASLGKIKDYRGEVYRVMSDFDGTFAASLTPGKNMSFNSFTSAARTTNPSYKPFDYASRGETRFIIHSKRGKLIESASSIVGEREVVFRRGTNFHIQSKRYNVARGTWDIVLREI